jgi:probable phosphoglycerate mutase
LVASVLEGKKPLVYSSPRQRALETARLALPDEAPIVERLLGEFDYGMYEGLTPTQVKSDRPGWNIWDDDCPGGESLDAVSLRADEFLATFVGPSNESPVIAVTHGHFSRILAARSLGLSPRQGRLFASATASVSVIADHHGERCVALWNVSPDLVSDHTSQVARSPVAKGLAN